MLQALASKYCEPWLGKRTFKESDLKRRTLIVVVEKGAFSLPLVILCFYISQPGKSLLFTIQTEAFPSRSLICHIAGRISPF